MELPNIESTSFLPTLLLHRYLDEKHGFGRQHWQPVTQVNEVQSPLGAWRNWTGGEQGYFMGKNGFVKVRVTKDYGTTALSGFTGNGARAV